jgi:ABC-type nitrate/sulfonate/bicarbonate transport system substrate-binding protein
MKRVVSYVFVVVFTAGLLVVSSSAEAEKLRIGAHRALMGSFEVIAHKMGYWKEEGLEYTFQYFKQGKLMRNAIIQGNLDTGTTGFSPFTTAVSKGARVTAIGVTANICDIQHIVVPVDSKIKSPAEFKGIVFANKKGTSTDFAFQSYVLPQYGLKSSDVQLLSVYTTDRIAAVASGSAQAAMVGDPQYEIAIQKGLVRELETLCKYDKTRMMHIGNPQTLQQHPELYEKYFRGWLKAHQLLQKDPEKYAEVYTKVLQEVGDKAEYKVILPVVKRLRSEVFLSDEVRAYLNDMGDKQQKLGWIKSHPDFTKSGMLDDSILRKVANDMGWPGPTN